MPRWVESAAIGRLPLERLEGVIAFYALMMSRRATTATIDSLPLDGSEVYLSSRGCYYCKISGKEHQRVSLHGFVWHEPELFDPDELVIRGTVQVLDGAA
jgi:hypothetical protein